MIPQISVSSGMRDIEGCLYVGPSDRATLERLVADGKTPQKIAKRASIVLLWSQRFGDLLRRLAIGNRLPVSPDHCGPRGAASLDIPHTTRYTDLRDQGNPINRVQVSLYHFSRHHRAGTIGRTTPPD